jgi:hypothetical protein
MSEGQEAGLVDMLVCLLDILLCLLDSWVGVSEIFAEVLLEPFILVVLVRGH